MKAMYVYILECSDGSFYVGVTNNLSLRFLQHQDGKNPGSYTYSRRPLKLVWSKTINGPLAAIRYEKKLKKWSRKKKLALINGEYHLLPGLSKKKNFTKK
jgi:putative endonuclease